MVTIRTGVAQRFPHSARTWGQGGPRSDRGSGGLSAVGKGIGAYGWELTYRIRSAFGGNAFNFLLSEVYASSDKGEYPDAPGPRQLYTQLLSDCFFHPRAPRILRVFPGGHFNAEYTHSSPQKEVPRTVRSSSVSFYL